MLKLDEPKDQDPLLDKLRTPLKLVRHEMRIPHAKSLDDAQKSVEAAYKKMISLPKQKESIQSFSQPAELKLVQQAFTDKLICIKDSTWIKLLHRGQYTDELAIDSLTSFYDPPRTLESRITLQIQANLVTPFFCFLNWQSMFKENSSQGHFLGLIRKVFDSMLKRSCYVETQDGGFIQFSVKLTDMKHFIDFASMHLQLAINMQSRDLSDQSQQLRDRRQNHLTHRLAFQPENIPTLDELQVA